MIDESTNISLTSDLVIFASVIEGGSFACVFLGLHYIVDGKKDVALIFKTSLTNMIEWGLGFDKYLGFG